MEPIQPHTVAPAQRRASAPRGGPPTAYESARINISGTEQREMLSKGVDVPLEFSRPEVITILREYYASLE